MLAGGDGVISVTSNLVPDRMQAMCAAALAGDLGLARALNTALDPLHQGLFVESNPIPVKWALAEMGLCQPGIRLPLTWLSASHHDRLRASLRELNCIAA
jgi:4-hydroxy-tetrahydrodipicolinate synthase